MPDKDLKSLMAVAAQAEQRGDFRLSEETYREVLASNPNHREAFLFHSLTLVRLGRTKEAVVQLKHLLTIDPKCLLALNWLSKLQREGGRLQSALSFSERAVQVSPRDPETLYNLGLCYLGLKRFEEAILCFERSTEVVERFGPGYYALACAYEEIGQPWQALIAIRKNVEIDANPRGFLKAAELNLAVGDTDQAAAFGFKALAGSAGPEAHLLLAEALADSDVAASNAHLQEALEAHPDLKTVFQNHRAKSLSRLGRLDEAREINASLRDQAGAPGEAYLNWVTLKKIDSSDSDILKRIAERLDDSALGWEDRGALHMALGKSFDDLGDYASAISHFDLANELKFANSPALQAFDREGLVTRIDRLLELYTKEFLAENASRVNESEKPIFILGMMRTGTTLMEQTIARHPRVAAAGELAHWAFSSKKIVDLAVGKIHQRNLAECTRTYLEILQTVDPNAQRVTDKNPANLMEVGLIRLAFPNAHIVQMARDPIDTAISVYITPTRRPPEFGCSRENIAFAIQEMDRLAAHWQRVQPEDRYHVVRYEELVSNPEEVIPALISSCGLDPAEMEGDAAGAMIGTPSLWQARQPINTASIGRGERYAPWLGAFESLA